MRPAALAAGAILAAWSAAAGPPAGAGAATAATPRTRGAATADLFLDRPPREPVDLPVGTARPTLTAEHTVAGLPAVVWGDPATLTGRETLRGTRTFVLQASAFPFRAGFRTIAIGRTTGSYSVLVRPTHATRYRLYIRTGGARLASRVLTVYVLVRTVRLSCNLCSSKNRPGEHTLILDGVFEAPPGHLHRRGPAYFYYAQIRSSAQPAQLRLVRTVARHFSGQRFTIAVSYRVRFPPGPVSFATAVCWRSSEPLDGVGLPGHHHCGQRVVRRGEYLG